MIKNSYKIRAQKFIRDIYPYLTEQNFHNLKEAINKFNSVKHRKVKYDCGSSRKCLISSDYVVKIDYDPYSYFGNCESELEKWEYISKTPFAKNFAPISKYIYNGHDFYIMPFIPNVGKYEDEIDEDFLAFFGGLVEDIHERQFGKKNGTYIFIDYAC